ncbi:hypothetical protein V8D89_011822 [Ganoderma adspersum]
MATCHILYHEGAKIILRNWTVTFDLVTSEQKTLSLLRFIQAEQFSRCAYVRKLFVSLLPAFASLRSVEGLIVNGAECSCELIQSLQSQLVSAQLYFSPYFPQSGHRLYLAAAFHPLIMLQRSASTLKTLFCGFWCDMDPKIFASPPKVQYPSMHALTLYECRNPQGLTPYIKSFPNLAHLNVEENGSRWDLNYAPVAVIHRNWNLARQGFWSTGESLSWKQLHDYSGYLVDLWFLGLSCPIPRLSLNDTPSARPPHALTDVLGTAHPTELTIAFQKCSLTDILKTDFLSALRSDGALDLRRLTVFIELRAQDHVLDVGRALKIVGATISHLSLTHLDIRVTDAGLDEPEEGTDRPGLYPFAPPRDSAPRASAASTPSESEGPLSLGERTLDEFDVDAFMWNLLRGIRTLEDTFVSIQRPRRCDATDRGARVKSAGFELGFSDQGVEIQGLSRDKAGEGLCKMAECVKEEDAWWGEIAERNVKFNRM